MEVWSYHEGMSHHGGMVAPWRYGRTMCEGLWYFTLYDKVHAVYKDVYTYIRMILLLGVYEIIIV